MLSLLTPLLLSLLPTTSSHALPEFPRQTIQNCSIKGYDLNTHPAFYLNSTTPSPSSCKTFCAGYTTPPHQCLSFAYGTGVNVTVLGGGYAISNVCLLYNVTVNGNVLPVGTSNYTFWDLGCTV